MAKINTSTIEFLKDLAKNNHRTWFQDNKSKFDEAVDNVKTFIAEVKKGMEKKDHIEGMKLFRIYRDVRFSKDKSPYKTNFGIAFKRATAKLRGGYYLQIQPGNSFVGGGFWGPNPTDLKRIRKEFEMDDTTIRKIIKHASFKTYFGELIGDEVKTAPKGFDINHPAIDLIRKKQFIVKRQFTDKEVIDPSFSKEVVKSFEAMRPFFDYMSEVLTTDLNGQSTI